MDVGVNDAHGTSLHLHRVGAMRESSPLSLLARRSELPTMRFMRTISPLFLLVALIASSSASLRLFISASDGAPTRTMATPPDSLARRSCSFSRS